MARVMALSNLQTSALHPYLVRLGRRLRLRDGWRQLQRTLWVAVLSALLIQVVGRYWPIAELTLWTIFPLGLWLFSVAAAMLLRRQTAMQIARRIDRELALKERLSTAVALADLQEDALLARQRADALAVAQAINPVTAFPLRWQWRPWLAAALLTSAVAILAYLPNPMNQLLAERAAVAAALQEQAAPLAELRQELENAQELSPEEKADLLRQLAELTEQLRANPGDREEALADFARVEETLRAQIDPDLSAQQETLDALAAQLHALAQSQSSAAPDPADMSATLQDLAAQLGEMEPAQREALAQSLAQLANSAAQSGSAEVARALSTLAQSAQTGDSSAAAQAAESAAQALTNAATDLAAQSRRQETLAQVQAGRQAVAQAGQAGATAQAGQGQSPGQNQSAGQNAGQGQNASQNQGQGAGSGGGTRANTLPLRTSSGRPGRFQGSNPAAAVNAPDQQIYVPFERRASNGNKLFIPGQETGQGETQVREERDPLPGAANPALVPYQEVYYDYVDAANATMERGNIPPGLQEYVRDYFSQLEP